MCVCVYMCVHTHTGHGVRVHVEVKGQLAGVSSLLSPLVSGTEKKFPYPVRHLTGAHFFFSDLYSIKLEFVENSYLQYCFSIHKMVSFP